MDAQLKLASSSRPSRAWLVALAVLLACGGSSPNGPQGSDSGTPDAGQPDAGQPDAGQPDGGQPDAGAPDGGASATLTPSLSTACVAAGDAIQVAVHASASLAQPPNATLFGRTTACSGSGVDFTCDVPTQVGDPAGAFTLSLSAPGATSASVGGTLGTSIAGLRTHWSDGAQVEVCEAVVTAVRRNASASADQVMYVADPQGGPNSGIELFRAKTSSQLLPALYDHLRIVAKTATYAGHLELIAPSGGDLQLTLLAHSFVPPPRLSHAWSDLVKDMGNHAADEALGSVVDLSDAPVTLQNATPAELAFVQSDGGVSSDGIEVANNVLVDLYPYTKECVPDGGYPAGASYRPVRGIYDYVGLPDGGGYHAIWPVRCPDLGWPTPIQYVVVIVKENHTFENYFTGFPGATWSTTATLSDGGVITRPVAPAGGLPRDVSHSHTSAVIAWADGGMTGFDDVYNAEPDGGAPDYLPFTYYTESQIPAYWAYARQFVLEDNFRSTLLGPTMPGHFATVTAQTPFIDNSYCPSGDCSLNGCNAPVGTKVHGLDQSLASCQVTSGVYPCFDVPSVVDALPPGLTWAAYSYGSDTTSYSPFNLVKSIGTNAAVRSTHLLNQDGLLADLTSGNQPNLVIASITTPGDLSEHPPDDPCTGQNYTVQLVNAIMQGPHWDQTAIVITWDDYGGFYDSVAPPVERCANGQVFQPGFRLPALVISPYAKQGVVLHTATEQASIPRLVEELFDLPFMSRRDPNARDGRSGSLLGAFDFTQSPRPPYLVQPMTCP